MSIRASPLEKQAVIGVNSEAKLTVYIETRQQLTAKLESVGNSTDYLTATDEDIDDLFKLEEG